MKKIALVTAILAALVSTAAYLTCVAIPVFTQQIKGSGTVVTRTIPAPQFDAVSVSRAVKVMITDQTDGQIRIAADDNLIEHVVVKTDGGELEITMDKSLQNISNADVTVTIPANGRIRSLEASSAASIKTEVPLQADSFEVDASSAAKITAQVSAAKCDVGASSAAKINLTLTADDCSVDASSAAKITLTGTVERFIAEASSASKIYAEKVVAKCADLEASSGADIAVCCTDELHAEASSGADISYTGDCRASISKSSGGSVRKN